MLPALYTFYFATENHTNLLSVSFHQTQSQTSIHFAFSMRCPIHTNNIHTATQYNVMSTVVAIQLVEHHLFLLPGAQPTQKKVTTTRRLDATFLTSLGKSTALPYLNPKSHFVKQIVSSTWFTVFVELSLNL